MKIVTCWHGSNISKCLYCRFELCWTCKMRMLLILKREGNNDYSLIPYNRNPLITLRNAKGKKTIPWRLLRVQRERRRGYFHLDPTSLPAGHYVGRPYPWSWPSAANPHPPPRPPRQACRTETPQCCVRHTHTHTHQGHMSMVQDTQLHGKNKTINSLSVFGSIPSGVCFLRINLISLPTMCR